MSTPSVRQDPGAVYRRYLSAVVLHGQAAAEAVGLNPTDLYALNLLALSGPLTSGELAERTGLTTGRDHPPDRPGWNAAGTSTAVLTRPTGGR